MKKLLAILMMAIGLTTIAQSLTIEPDYYQRVKSIEKKLENITMQNVRDDITYLADNGRIHELNHVTDILNNYKKQLVHKLENISCFDRFMARREFDNLYHGLVNYGLDVPGGLAIMSGLVTYVARTVGNNLWTLGWRYPTTANKLFDSLVTRRAGETYSDAEYIEALDKYLKMDAGIIAGCVGAVATGAALVLLGKYLKELAHQKGVNQRVLKSELAGIDNLITFTATRKAILEKTSQGV